MLDLCHDKAVILAFKWFWSNKFKRKVFFRIIWTFVVHCGWHINYIFSFIINFCNRRQYTSFLLTDLSMYMCYFFYIIHTNWLTSAFSFFFVNTLCTLSIQINSLYFSLYINFYFYIAWAAMLGLSVRNIKELRLQNLSIKIGNFLYNLINETYISWKVL